MLRAILAAYGELPIQLWVHPAPDDMPLNAAQLTAWYGRFGFAPLPERPGGLERAPQPPVIDARQPRTALSDQATVAVPYRWTSDAGGRSHILRAGSDASRDGGTARVTLCGRNAADWLDWDLAPEEASCLRCHRIWQGSTKASDAGAPARSATGDPHDATPYRVVPDNNGGSHDHRNVSISEG
jgi:hypothetical protein